MKVLYTENNISNDPGTFWNTQINFEFFSFCFILNTKPWIFIDIWTGIRWKLKIFRFFLDFKYKFLHDYFSDFKKFTHFLIALDESFRLRCVLSLYEKHKFPN